mgnify:CR=1 FL=1
MDEKVSKHIFLPAEMFFFVVYFPLFCTFSCKFLCNISGQEKIVSPIKKRMDSLIILVQQPMFCPFRIQTFFGQNHPEHQGSWQYRVRDGWLLWGYKPHWYSISSKYLVGVGLFLTGYSCEAVQCWRVTCVMLLRLCLLLGRCDCHRFVYKTNTA